MVACDLTTASFSTPNAYTNAFEARVDHLAVLPLLGLASISTRVTLNEERWGWRMFKYFRAFLERFFCPTVHTVGNKTRALGKGEFDEDEKCLSELNRVWRNMLREDVWAKKLRTHVRLLRSVSGALLLIFILSNIYLPEIHWIPTTALVANVLTVPYWFWVGTWHGRIEKKVFAEFKKRYGKNFHLG